MEGLHVGRHVAVEVLLRWEHGSRVLRVGGRGRVWGRVRCAVTWWVEERGAVAISGDARRVG